MGDDAAEEGCSFALECGAEEDRDNPIVFDQMFYGHG
jgi:hypothetical protein